MRDHQDLAPLRVVVEKELLHRDIIAVMISSGLMAHLTFIGGTCLRACYGSERLSEDLEFTAGAAFSAATLGAFPDLISGVIAKKYGLKVTVSEPRMHDDGVKTWTVKVETRPGRRDLPMQQINIDVCPVPSHDRKAMMLLDPYRSASPSPGLLLNAESREEILADKWIALGLRRSRIKHRDLWDILWLRRKMIKLPRRLIPVKLVDHGRNAADYLRSLRERIDAITRDPALRIEFTREMQRFLSPATFQQTAARPEFWSYLTAELTDGAGEVTMNLPTKGGPASGGQPLTSIPLAKASDKGKDISLER